MRTSYNMRYSELPVIALLFLLSSYAFTEIKTFDVLRKYQKKSDDLEEIRRKSDQSLKEIEHLQKKAASLKNDIKAKEAYNKNVEMLKLDISSQVLFAQTGQETNCQTVCFRE